MTAPMPRIDHVPIGATDSASTRQLVERLGFRPTPPGCYRPLPEIPDLRWPNACVLFRRGWLDLLQHRRFSEAQILPTRVWAPGPVMVQGLVLESASVERARDELKSEDCGIGKPYGLAHQYDGLAEEAPVILRLCNVKGLAGAAVATSLLERPDRSGPSAIDDDPRWKDHPNAVDELLGLAIAVSDSPQQWTAAKNLLQHAALLLPVAKALERFPTRDLLVPATPFVAALRFHSTDLDRTASALASGGVPFERHETRILVPPQAGPATMVEFNG